MVGRGADQAVLPLIGEIIAFKVKIQGNAQEVVSKETPHLCTGPQFQWFNDIILGQSVMLVTA